MLKGLNLVTKTGISNPLSHKVETSVMSFKSEGFHLERAGIPQIGTTQLLI